MQSTKAPSPNSIEFDQLAKCVDAIGTPDFPKAISDFCTCLCRADTVFLTALFDDQKPAPLFANHVDEKHRAALDLYLDVAFFLDPFFMLFREKRGDEVVTLKEIAPDDFRRSEYYQVFFKAMGLVDECGLLLHLSTQAALFFSFGICTGGRRMDPTRLTSSLPLIAALVRRHWTVLSPEQPDGTGRMAAHLEAAFNAFGSSVLSPREGEIVRMILQGHSSKAIARQFDNSPETIKVHRKRAYTKLGVGSQGELLSVFLAALSKMPATANCDPLQFYSPLE